MADPSAEVRAVFEHYDTNGDGMISLEELTNVMRSCGDLGDDELQMMFDEINKSGGENISYQDFVDWVFGAEECMSWQGQVMEAAGAAAPVPAEADEEVMEAAGAATPVPAEADEEAASSRGEGSDVYDEQWFDEDIPDVSDEELGNISRAHWVMAMGTWGMDSLEAGAMFDGVVEDYGDYAASMLEEAPGGGYCLPVCDLIWYLDMEDDQEGKRALAEACAQAREAPVDEAPPEEAEVEEPAVEEPAAGEAETEEATAGGDAPAAEGDAPATEGDAPAAELLETAKAALLRIMRHLDQNDGAAEDAVALAKDPEFLSKLELDALASIPEEELVAKVKELQLSPPLLNSTAGAYACSQRAKAYVASIVAKCKEEGTKFTDPDWDTSSPELVLWVDKEKPGYDNTVSEPAGWKRLSEVVEDPVLCKDGGSANDIVQGEIGTCFLLGAMGSIVSNDPRSLKKIFIAYDFEVGIFAVRFNVEGEWMYVVIDDIMPVNAWGGLIFCSSKDPQECWAPLLEKAYCKLHTCYEMCDGGWPEEAISCFFGGVNGIFTITDEHRQNPETYFKMLKRARQRGIMLTTGFSGRPSGGQGKCGEAVLECGLVGDHAYSVLRCVEAEGNRLVCCRNPWGQGEWTGKWGDNNAEGEWTDAMNEATGHTLEKDGTFWMSIEDFVANSDGVEYARAFGPQWKKVSQYGRFQKGKMRCKAKWDFEATAADELSLTKGEEIEILHTLGDWLQGKSANGEGCFPGDYVRMMHRPVAKFELSGDAGCKAFVVLLQPNVMFARKWYTRHEDGLHYKDTRYPGMQLIVQDVNGKRVLKKVGRSRCHWGEVTLPEDGEPLSIYALSIDGAGTRFTLRVYVTGGAAALKDVEGASVRDI